VAEGPRDPSSSGIEEAFITARQDSAPQRRLEALRFLGEHALPKDLDALQQIQIQDPAPEVRRAAEEATQLLMARFSGQPWPGIPSGHNPSSYMKETASPQTP
jgi:HEAT repeat protein